MPLLTVLAATLYRVNAMRVQKVGQLPFSSPKLSRSFPCHRLRSLLPALSRGLRPWFELAAPALALLGAAAIAAVCRCFPDMPTLAPSALCLTELGRGAHSFPSRPSCPRCSSVPIQVQSLLDAVRRAKAVAEQALASKTHFLGTPVFRACWLLCGRGAASKWMLCCALADCWLRSRCARLPWCCCAFVG